MNRLSFLFIPLCVFVFWGCQKELSYELGINAPATGTLKDSLGNCDSMSVNGTYTENQALGSSNTVTITVNVTGAGKYRISTDTVNGYSFIDSGFFANPGTYQVTLQGTGTPILPTTNNFTVNFGTSFCTFDVTVQPGTSTGNINAADTAWMFDEGTMHFQGHVDSALVKTTGGISYLNIYGKPKTNDSTIFIQLQLSSPTAPPSGTYSTAAGTAVFEFKTPAGATIYDSRQTDGSNLTFTITAFDPSTKVMDAIYSGTVKDATTGTKNVTAGKLKLQVQ